MKHCHPQKCEHRTQMSTLDLLLHLCFGKVPEVRGLSLWFVWKRLINIGNRCFLERLLSLRGFCVIPWLIKTIKKPMLYRQFNWPALAFGGILMTPADKRLDSRSSTFFWLRLFSGGRTCGILMTPADKSLNSRSSTFTCGTAETRGCGYKMGSSKMLRR